MEPVPQIEQVSPEQGNQELRETIEIVFQITAQLDVENIVKNVAWSLVARFQLQRVTFILAKDIDEDAFEVISYEGLEPAETSVQIPSLADLLRYLEDVEYNQIDFSQFARGYGDRKTIESFLALATDMILPLRTDRGVGGLVLLPAKASGAAYTTNEIQYITRILRFAAVALENANLYWQATTDRMTRLYSHHFFQESLEAEMRRTRRLGDTFSLLMLDIDHFKSFNDRYGHLQGDIIIEEIAGILKSSTRQVDLCARYGGEEFTVILPGVGLEGATALAERLRRRVEAFEFPGTQGPLHVTISVGVAEFDPAAMESLSQVIAAADQALYASKEGGRNRVSTYAPAAGER